MIEKRLRADYTGEFVVTHTFWKRGRKEQVREWIDNPIENTSINHRACCVTPGSSIETFPLIRLQEHRGGLLSRMKMQLYGAEGIWEKLVPDFLIVLGQERLTAIIKSGYQVDHIVYTTTRMCIENPQEFYLIPHGILMSAAAIAVWMACFDGHQDIYLFGYDIEDANFEVQTKLIVNIQEIMLAYPSVLFHHVSNVPSPDEWRRCINCDRITRDTFVSECDI